MTTLTDQTIVVPWDFSDMSKAALAKALELAESAEQIDVVHVTPYEADMEPGIFWGTKTEEGIRRDIRVAFEKNIPEGTHPGLTFISLFGDPGREIAGYAKEVDAGLVVISSHGRRGLSRLLLGSVAERVLRLAHCPVLVLRGEEVTDGE